MAVVRLSDAIIPAVYTSYQTVDSPELTAFYTSGVVTRSALLDQFANEGGNVISIPFWNDIVASDEPNVSSDDPAVLAVPKKITAGEMTTRKAFLNQGWSSMDLVSELAGSDPMRRIRARTDVYWTRQWQRRLISASLGLLADNVAANASDMVSDISIQDGNNAGEANVFSRTAFTGAIFTLGDQFQKLAMIAVHSTIYKRMVDNDEIITVYDSKGTLIKQTYYGLPVVVDDSMPVIPGTTSGFRYVSVLFGNGAFGYGNGSPRVPVEVDRKPDAGNGGGQETLWERKTYILHPRGYDFTSASVAGQSATLAELQLATNWTRVLERKHIPLAFLITNG